jgi:sugar phosphate isomerase/epimerase
MLTSYRLGLVSISFRNHTPEAILVAARDAGLSYIEWGSDVHAPCKDLEGLREIAALQIKYGIECSSYGTYFRLGETPIEELGCYISAAKLLGTSVLRLWCGTKSGKDMTGAEREALLAQCRKAAEIAEEHDVMLCMECHKNTFTERVEDTLYLMNAVASPNFRMYWQPFQWLEPEENLEIARAVKPFAEHLHVFNWRGRERLPLSDAVDVWRGYLAALPAPRTLLLEFMPDNRLESLPIEAQALRMIAGEQHA